MRTSHNKLVSNLVPVGVQSSVQPPVTPNMPSITPTTPGTKSRFLDPESPNIEQQPSTTFTGAVYFFGQVIDQTGQVHFVRSPTWTGLRKAELPQVRDVIKVHKQTGEWNGEHWDQPAWTTCCCGSCDRRAVVGYDDVHAPIFCCRGCWEFHAKKYSYEDLAESSQQGVQRKHQIQRLGFVR